MTPALDEHLFNYVDGLADDALVLGHRLSEWSGRAPMLEEDIALSNLALDLIGQARLHYAYAGEIEGKGRSEDDLAYFRDARQFRNILLVEQPNGDFATSSTPRSCIPTWKRSRDQPMHDSPRSQQRR